MERRGIEGDVAMFGKVQRQQADETDEDLLDALRCFMIDDGMLLGILHVKQKCGIEHAQNLAPVDVVGMQVADDFAHPLLHMLGLAGR